MIQKLSQMKIRLKWPHQGKPTRANWAVWTEFLDSLLVVLGAQNGRVFKKVYQTTRWYCTHQRWEWVGNNRAALHKTSRRYWRNNDSLKEVEDAEIMVETLCTTWEASIKECKELGRHRGPLCLMTVQAGPWEKANPHIILPSGQT